MTMNPDGTPYQPQAGYQDGSTAHTGGVPIEPASFQTGYAPPPQGAYVPQPGYAQQGYAPQGYAPQGYAPQPGYAGTGYPQAPQYAQQPGAEQFVGQPAPYGGEYPQTGPLLHPVADFASVADRLRSRNNGNFSVDRNVRLGWALFKQRWQPLLLWGIISVTLLGLSNTVFGNDAGDFFWRLFVNIALLAISPGIYIATFNALRNTSFSRGDDLHAVGHALRWQDLYLGIYWILPSLGISLCVGIAIMIGLFLCIIPGIYLAVALSFSLPLYYEFKHEGLALFETLSVSNKVVARQFWQVLWLQIVFVLLLLLGSLCLGVGIFVAYPVGCLAFCFAFVDLFGLSANRPVDRKMEIC